jgi:hypothetical protein
MSRFAWKWETPEERELPMSSNNQATIYLEAVIEIPEDAAVSDGTVVIREPSIPEKANLKLVFDLSTGALIDARKD